MNGNNKPLLELMQSIEVRKQTEHRLKATVKVARNGVLRQAVLDCEQSERCERQVDLILTSGHGLSCINAMSVLLARSENQILVLETLLKRLVQVCVHTQDKRLAKELKLMDFTRLAKKIGDDHQQMRQMIMQEDGMGASSSPAENFLVDSMHSGPPGSVAPQQHMEDPQGMSAGTGGGGLGHNAHNLTGATGFHRSPSIGPSSHGGMPPHMMPMQPPHQGGLHQHQHMAPQGQHIASHMRRDGSAAAPGARDSSLQLRQLWPEKPGMEGSMIPNMGPGGMGPSQGSHGPGGNGMMMQGQHYSSQPYGQQATLSSMATGGNYDAPRAGPGPSNSARMRMAQMTRSASAAGSQLTNPGQQGGGGSGGGARGYPDADAFSGFS